MDGRIIKGIGGLYFVDTEQGIYNCRPRGIFRKDKIKPVIGDFVVISILSQADNEGVIDHIYERKNELLRPKVSNIDQSILVFSTVSPDINIDLLDRLTILSEEQNLDIVVCINKADISNRSEYESIKKDYENIGYKVIFTSTKTGEGIQNLKNLLQNKISVFSGPSGVGKSSLANFLVPSTNMETGCLSKNNKGKHTTRHAQLIKLAEKSYIVDAPGFTSLFLEHIQPESLAYLFKEFRPFINACKFNDCHHINEPFCEVKQHIDINITSKRYNRYVNLFGELHTRP